MTPTEAHALLAYASALDPRVRRNDPADRDLQALAWTRLLASTAAPDAVAAVDKHYSRRPGTDPVMPADILASVTDKLPSSRPIRDVLAALPPRREPRDAPPKHVPTLGRWCPHCLPTPTRSITTTQSGG